MDERDPEICIVSLRDGWSLRSGCNTRKGKERSRPSKEK